MPQPLENRQRIGILPRGDPKLDRSMGWLDIYILVLFLALIGLLVSKFRS